jgi:hypothetical protein
MKIKRILREMICILLLSLAVSLVYNAISPTGIKLIRQKQKQVQGLFLDTGFRTIQEALLKSRAAAW